jgi:hypothetical protein
VTLNPFCGLQVNVGRAGAANLDVIQVSGLKPVVLMCWCGLLSSASLPINTRCCEEVLQTLWSRLCLLLLSPLAGG